MGATAAIGLSVTLAACSSSDSTGSVAAGGGEAGALGVSSGGAESSGGSESGESGGASAGGAGVGGGALGSGGQATGGGQGIGGSGTGGDPGSGGSGATGGSSENDPLTQEQCDELEARYAEVLVEARQCNPAYSGPLCLERVFDGIACGCEVPVVQRAEALDELAFLQIEFSEGSCPTPAICFMGGACLEWTAADCTEAGTCGIIE